jgi:DNA-binding beta-propeller fold protein YncE
MMKNTRTRALAAASAVLVATGALAAPASAATTTDATTITTVQLPKEYYALCAGAGAMWALSNDEYSHSILYRIDAATNSVTETVALGYPAVFCTVADGSIWITDYLGNALHRYDLAGHELARIPVGLQPQFVHAAFGSIWTADHHSQSLTRIDPATNGVIATLRVGADQLRDGPQDFTWDGSYLYAESSNLPYLQRIDPATNTVHKMVNTGLEEAYGGDLAWRPGPEGGTLWNASPYDGTLRGYDVLGGVRVTITPQPGHFAATLAAMHHQVYYVDELPHRSTSVVHAIDQVTGQQLSTFPVTGRPLVLRAAFGDLWSVDQRGLLQRISVDGT